MAKTKSKAAASLKRIKSRPMGKQGSQTIFTQDAISARTSDGFENFVARLGLQQQNALSDGTYRFNLVTRNRILLEAAYRGSWIVGAVIDSVAEDMTRAGIDITTEEESRIEEVQAAMSRLQIWQSLRGGIKWGRLYGGAIGVIDIEGQDKSTELDPETVAKGQFKGIIIYDRWQLNPMVGTVIKQGADMGLPAFYSIVTNNDINDPINPDTPGGLVVHHSRLIRFTGIDLPFFQAITEQMWGESILERLWDRLIAFDTVTLSTANLVNKASLRTMKIEGLREIVAAGGPALEGLLAQLEATRQFQVNEGLTIMDKEDEHETDNYTFSGLPDTILQFGQQLSGASKIPLVRLFGQSPSGMNATGDGEIRLYYDGIAADQKAKLTNAIEKILTVCWRSTFGTSKPKDLQFTFVPLWQMSAIDKAIIAKSNTETILGAHDGGLVKTQTAVKELRQMSGDTGLFSNISDEEVDDAEDDFVPGVNDMPIDRDKKPDPAEKQDKPVPALDAIKNTVKKLWQKK